MAGQISGFLSPLLQRRRLAAARHHLGDGRLLDFGCADGALAAAVPPSRYVGVDRDGAILEQARGRHPTHRFLTLEELERDHEPFDVIVALAVIEHLPDPSTWLRSLHAKLQATGRVVLTTPHPSLRWAHEAGARIGLFSQEAADEHETLLDKHALQALAAESGFSIAVYRRFLGGANQLCVMEKKAGHEQARTQPMW